MYVNKKKSTISTRLGYFAKIQLLACSVHSGGLRRIYLYAYRYPCGRIKLVCPGASQTFIGGSWGCDVIFDSVSSLYNVPGVHIYTSPYCLYVLLGMTPYGCK